MGKIGVHSIPGGGGDGWDKLLEENFSLSGRGTSASQSTIDSVSFPINAKEYDMLYVEISGSVTANDSNWAGVAANYDGPDFFSTSVPDPFHALLVGNGRGFFYQSSSSSLRNFGISKAAYICLVGRQITASATGMVRIWGRKLKV